MRRGALRLGALGAAALATPAQAACSAGNTYIFGFAGETARAMAFDTDYPFTATTSGGASRGFTIRMSATGLKSNLVGGVTYPRINAAYSGASNANNLVMGGVFEGRTDGTSRMQTMTITFTTPVRDFTFLLNDVDYNYNQFRDIVRITGISGTASYTPVITTRWGQSNATGGTRTSTNSSLALGPTTTSDGAVVAANEAIGMGNADTGTDRGTLTASFAQPVTSVTIRYGNAPAPNETTTGQQAIGLETITFCPMPAVTFTKTSAPVASALGAYALPSNDVVYELTVNNAGGSPVDASSIVLTDALPAGVTFRNLAYDTTTLTNYSFTANGSGVSLASSGVTYSNNAGSSYAYTPASGYDPNVSALRFVPTGTMAANSSFSVRFKAQIK